MAVVEIEASGGGRPSLARLEPGDEGALERFFGRLSAESLYRRFFSPMLRADRFANALLRVDAMDRAALAAVEHGEVVGVAQYSRRPGAHEADLAIVVADAWQGQGIGTRLVAALADHAAMAGIQALSVDVQGDNGGALRLLRRVAPGLRLAFSGGVGEGSFAIGR
jgi:ribosomal protein S18 acetylase RimI-like enzyme